MDGIRVGSSLSIPLDELTFRFSRSSGPGGQNVNRRETRVELIFDVAGSRALDARQRERAMDRLGHRLDSEGRLHVVVSDERSQFQNRERAIERFQTVMAEALKPPPPARRKTKPSKGATQRRLDDKSRRSRIKRDRKWSPED